jgi:FkbM family methyltransferase
MSIHFANYLSENTGFDAVSLHKALRTAVAEYLLDPCKCLPALPSLNGTARPVVVLLGTTPFSQLFIMECASQVDIVGVVDDFQSGNDALFHNVPIINSVNFLSMASQHTIVAVNGCRYDHSRRYFKNLTLRHQVPMLNFEQAIRWLGVTCADHRIQDWGSYIAEHIEPLAQLAQRFEDEYSRITFFCVLLSHITCNPEWSLNCAKPYLTLYFRSGLWVPDAQERFVDCGASIAESTKALLDATDGQFDKIWMIEPDEVNQVKLTAFIESYQQDYALNHGSIELVKAALGSEQGEMPFLHEGGHGGHLLATATDNAICRNVQVRTLDQLIDSPVTLIKMDMEGAELAALQGARRLITEHKPKLAVSAYHRASDLLDLVNFVNSLREDYRIGLRHHTEERWDTCLYFY